MPGRKYAAGELVRHGRHAERVAFRSIEWRRGDATFTENVQEEEACTVAKRRGLRSCGASRRACTGGNEIRRMATVVT